MVAHLAHCLLVCNYCRMTSNPRSALICGAGIAGLTLAWWLRRDGWRVTMVEQAPGPRAAGYMIDFFGSGYDVAELMDLLPELRKIHTTITTVSYVDHNGRPEGRIDYLRVAAAFDGRVFSFMRGELERVLYSALGSGLDLRYGTTVDRLTETVAAVEAGLSDGSTEPFDLVIGADGIHSRVRELVFGPQEDFVRYLGYHTASYLISDDELRERVGQRFLLIAAPGRQAGLYPTMDGGLAVWLVHEAEDSALPADPRATIQQTYAGMGELADRALRLCPEDPYYDQVAQIELDEWTRGRVTLAGDACQAVSLMAGQGASMAMGGAYVLADALRRTTSVPEALRLYQHRMVPDVRVKQKSGRRTAQWLVPPTRLRIFLRRLGLAAADLPGASGLYRLGFRAMAESVVPQAESAGRLKRPV